MPQMRSGSRARAFVIKYATDQQRTKKEDTVMSTENKMSPLKTELLKLSDAEIAIILRKAGLFSSKARRTGHSKADKTCKWYDQELCGLSHDARKQLEEIRSRASQDERIDRKWLRYAEAFNNMRLAVPDWFRSTVDARAIYNRLVDFSRANDLPDELIVEVVPEICQYIETGHMRPIMFIGEKGCGKTTGVRMLLQEALQIPVETIKVPEVSGGYGLTGYCATYRAADLGSLARAQFRNNSLLVGYVFDEIDKVSHASNEAGVDEELLSVTDESVNTIEDKYLGSVLTGLPYCPIFMTGNDFSRVNPILADRCKVIRYPRATPQRIQRIIAKYVQKKISTSTYSMIEFDYALLYESIDKLVRRSVTSLRKHQELAEHVLSKAFVTAMTTSAEKVKVTQDMFLEAEQQIQGAEARRVGFNAA